MEICTVRFYAEYGEYKIEVRDHLRDRKITEVIPNESVDIMGFRSWLTRILGQASKASGLKHVIREVSAYR